MTLDLAPLFDSLTYQFLLVFARIGGAIMLLPGIGDMRVPIRVRLLFGLALSALTLGNGGPCIAGDRRRSSARWPCK
jgi:flagellar biosynthetic protein FliR